MSFKTCRQLIHEDFRKVLTQQPHGKISEYLYILRYLLPTIHSNFVFGSDWAAGQKERKEYYLSISFHG